MHSRRLQHVGAVLLILLGNLYVCRELFVRHYLNQMGSIEGAFIAIARYASQNWGDLTWFPLWYNGIPYENTYPPVLHLIVAAVATVTGAEAALAYHMVVAFFYCAGAATVYALSWRLSRSVAGSFWAAAIYSFLSPSAFLIEDIRKQMGSAWRPRRLQTLLVYGEGPHVAGLALLPVAILLLDVAVKRRKPWWTALAALAFAATVLTNWLAAAALGAAVVAYFAGNFSLATVRQTAVVAVLAYCFAAPWIPPSNIRVIQFNAKMVGGDFSKVYQSLPVYGSAACLGLAILVYMLVRFRASGALRFGVVFGYLMGLITLAAAWFDISILPQPHRYHLEMELGLSMAAAFLMVGIAGRLPRRVAMGVAVVAAVAMIWPAKEYRRFARLLMAPLDISKTVEYKAGQWLKGNMPDGRVVAAGSVSFWMNVWTDTPQLGGGFDQGTTNFMNRVAVYVLYSDDGVAGDRLATSELWLKAFGVDGVQAGGPGSAEYYKPYQHPEKFEGRYKALWRDGADVIYEVPRRSRSQAHVVSPGDLAQRTPVNGIDLEPLKPYVAALDDPANPVLESRWMSRHSMKITGNVPAGKVISVQVSGDPGWRVSRGTVRKDGLGLVVIEPGCAGPCEVTLEWDGGMEHRIVRWLAVGAMLVCLAWSGVVLRRRES